MPTSNHPQVEEILSAAWTHCAPARLPSVQYPHGFWPDVGRIAVELALGLTPSFGALSTHQTGLEPRPPRVRMAPSRRGKISAEDKRANTLALLAKLQQGES